MSDKVPQGITDFCCICNGSDLPHKILTLSVAGNYGLFLTFTVSYFTDLSLPFI